MWTRLEGKGTETLPELQLPWGGGNRLMVKPVSAQTVGRLKLHRGEEGVGFFCQASIAPVRVLQQVQWILLPCYRRLLQTSVSRHAASCFFPFPLGPEVVAVTQAFLQMGQGS